MTSSVTSEVPPLVDLITGTRLITVHLPRIESGGYTYERPSGSWRIDGETTVETLHSRLTEHLAKNTKHPVTNFDLCARGLGDVMVPLKSLHDVKEVYVVETTGSCVVM